MELSEREVEYTGLSDMKVCPIESTVEWNLLKKEKATEKTGGVKELQ